MTYSLLCQHCGSAFLAKRPYSKYCSKLCSNRARERNRKLRLAADPEMAAKRKEIARSTYQKNRKYYVDWQRNYYKTHKEQQIITTRRWKAANPDKHASHERNYRARRNDRVAKQADGTAGAVIQKILFGSSCLYCGVKLRSIEEKRIDHMVPIASGGLHSACNLALCCASCNSKKSAMEFTDWLTTLDESRQHKSIRYYTKLNGAPPEQFSLLIALERKKADPKILPKQAERDARAAWDWWMNEGAPSWWLDDYWKHHPKPWADKRLTKAQQFKVRYHTDHEFRIYQIYNRPSRKNRKSRANGKPSNASQIKNGHSGKHKVFTYHEFMEMREKSFQEFMAMRENTSESC